MKTKRLKLKTGQKGLLLMLLILGLWILPQNALAHCDSYDGPVIKDALKALETNEPTLVMKWIDAIHEKDITALFSKTMKYKTAAIEIYSLLEKHFLETLVKIHREGEGKPYTGLKHAGSTKQIIQLTDTALANKDLQTLFERLNGHVGKIFNEKYEKFIQLEKEKDQSAEIRK